MHRGAANFDLVTNTHHFSLLVHEEIHGEASFLKSLETAQKLGLNTLGEAIASNAFSSPVPLSCHDPDKSPGSTSNEPAFSQHAKHTQWQAARDQFKKKTNSVRTGLEKSIKAKIPASDPAHQICLLSVWNTASNLEGLMHFSNATVEELKTHGLDVDKAFASCTHLASACFHECHRVGRAGVHNSFDTSNRDDLAGIIWHSVCQTQDVMQDFQSLDWKDHLVIAGVCIWHLVENSQSTAPTTFETRLKELRDLNVM